MTDTYYTQGNSPTAGSGDELPEETSAAPYNPSKAEAPEKLQGDEVITSSVLKSALSELERKLQSRTDKVVGSLDKRVAQAQAEAQKAIDLFKGAGNTLTPEQETQIRQSAINRAITDIPNDQQPREAQPQGRQVNPDVDAIARYVNDELVTMQREADVYISPAELMIRVPDFNKLKPHQAIAKFAELVDERKTTKTTNPASRLPYTQSGSVATDEALRAAYTQELQAIPRGVGNRADKIALLKAKYQKKGLDVT